MTDRYCDPLAAGLNNGTSKINAWQTLQLAADTAIAGMDVYCRHTNDVDETLAAPVDFNTNGKIVNTRIRFIGVNTDWVDDGTHYVLDGNSAALRCIAITSTATGLMMKNFECKNATGDGLSFSSGYFYYGIFENIRSHDNTGDGFGAGNAYTPRYTVFLRCAANDNVIGFDRIAIGNSYVACEIIGNSSNGMVVTEFGDRTRMIGCIFSDNGGDGLDITVENWLVYQCVFDDNTDDGIYYHDAAGTSAFVYSSRFTNNGGDGIYQVTSTGLVENWNIFYNNGGSELNGPPPGRDSRGDNGEHIHDDVTEAGYEDVANRVYTIDPLKIYRSQGWEMTNN